MTGGHGGNGFRIPQDELLAGLLRQGFRPKQAEAVVHALADIAESIEKIYGSLLPELMKTLNQPDSVFKDRLWDIREEFRHVAYHIEDANLTDL